ncbi:MAG: SPOR domain-containing protein, partial [Gammaproteobacteria bacterium]
MRNIILSLVFANLLMLAWGRWIAPGEVSDPRSFGGSAAAALDPKLVLYTPAKAEPEPDPDPVSALVEQPDLVQPIVAVMQCERIGPFDNPEPALSIAQQLGQRGLTVEIGSETGDIWVGHWVQIADLGTPPAARQAVEQLVQAGLNDAYI